MKVNGSNKGANRCFEEKEVLTMQLPDSVQNVLSYGQGYKDGYICGFHDALVCAVHDLTGLLKKYHDMEKEYAGLQAKAYHERMENKPQLESATKNHARWIPCSERLPEPLQNVIICTDIKTVTVAWINGDEWHFADTGNGHIEQWGLDDVTHWMPLPEPLQNE